MQPTTYISTFLGNRFYPAQPHIDGIDIVDKARRDFAGFIGGKIGRRQLDHEIFWQHHIHAIDGQLRAGQRIRRAIERETLDVSDYLKGSHDL